MTNKELIKRNIGLTFDFVHHLMDHPEVIVKLPKNFKLEFIDKDFTKLEKMDQVQDIESELTKKYVKVRNDFQII